MLTKSEKSFSFLFVILLALEIATSSFESLSDLNYLAKPALLISLIFYFRKQSSHLDKKMRLMIFLALIFSLIGDILLMFVSLSANYFIGGLVAFLTAHIFYVLIFLKQRNPSKNGLFFIGLMLAYGAILFYFLKDGLGDMLIPVIVYMLVILSMATTAFLREGKVVKNNYILVFTGAILFMISDSILALNKFYQPLPFTNFSIMFTYAFAQLFIVFGLLKQR
ncbi:lysoplasmalogenase [Xanthomarina sp. F1114]|uniref:lysoplasmalogenase n=1 Tax=Xanthomarina sp. F1114 TaxID=2996019 RepID=UPI00225E2D77|nr:lysoplasmalogenase [Xanthomarina sp. F1114]MCX7547259.1 lysoplasmalogenase [Xanthomarina sp. F1114]